MMEAVFLFGKVFGKNLFTGHEEASGPTHLGCPRLQRAMESRRWPELGEHLLCKPRQQLQVLLPFCSIQAQTLGTYPGTEHCTLGQHRAVADFVGSIP